jgi:hypothetical protein
MTIINTQIQKIIKLCFAVFAPFAVNDLNYTPQRTQSAQRITNHANI